ncbi:MAG: chitobiase/beta-hexosaminidase C-terminal domain-containing protein [Lachnospiraceae bacterium]|nr:chitobiase/beta-hexosaminidase C-terminal domain-containing protein [Lachnospiraceae bacterium]
MKIRNRILAGLLSFTVVMGELLPVYAAGDDQEYTAEEVHAAEEAGDEDDAEITEKADGDGMVKVTIPLIHEGAFPAAGENAGADRSGEADAAAYSEEAEEAVVAALRNRAASIDVSAYNVSTADVGAFFQGIVNAHPDLFYVTGAFSYGYRGGYVTVITPKYSAQYNTSHIEAFYATADRIIAKVDPSWPKLEKVLYLHDYLVTHCDYQKSQPYSKYDAYNALVEGEAVCQGYSEAFEYLLQRIGVEGQVVSSSAINHAWNVLRLDGQWYYIDNTWDDPTNRGGTYCGHKNFLRSRDGMYKSKENGGTGHTSTDWVGAEDGADIDETIPGGTTYDSYFWSNIASLLPLVGTKTLTVSGTKGTVYDLSDKSSQDYTINTGIWYVWGSKNSYWQGDFAQAVAVDGKFYYSTNDSIYSFALDGTQKKVYTLNSTESGKGYIYGLSVSEDESSVVYSLRTSPDTEVVYTGSVKVAEAAPQEKTATPVASPATGTSLSVGDTVSLSCATAGASIYYTTDGSTPTVNSALYENVIVVPESAAGKRFTVRAIAVAEGYLVSNVAAFYYTVAEIAPQEQTATPVASPSSGASLSVGDTVTLSCATAGASIYYTTDGSTPTESSTRYQNAIVVPESAAGKSFTLKAIAMAEGFLNSEAVSFTYVIAAAEEKVAAVPTADPADGSSLKAGDTIRLSCTTEGAEIRYTTDGSTPTESSTLYQSAIVVPESAAGKSFTLKAIAMAEAYVTSSVASFSYSVEEMLPEEKTAAPTAEPAGGSTLKVGDQIGLSCATAGAKIYFTTDGTKPTEQSALYKAPIVVEKKMAGKALTVKAFAVSEGLEDSTEVSFTYTVSDLSKLTLDRESVRITSKDKTIRLKATVYGSDGKEDDNAEVSFESGNTGVVTVSNDGVLSAVANGIATVTARSGKLSAECKVTVMLSQTEEETVFCTLDFYQEEQLVSSISVERGKYAEDIPEVKGLVCWYDGAAGEIWDPAAPVTRDMQLYACFDEDLENGHSALDPLPAITESSFYMVKGQSIDMSAEGTLELGLDNGTLKLSKKGVVSAKKAGTETLKVNGTVKYSFCVIEPALLLNGQAVKSLSLIPGAAQKLTVRCLCSGEDVSEHYPVYWYSSAPEIVSVNGGEVYAIAKGSTTITAYVNGKSYSCKVKVADTKKADVSVEDIYEEWDTVVLSALTLQPFQSYTLRIKGISFKNRDWYSEDSDLQQSGDGKKVFENDYVKVDSNGKITALGVGSCTLAFLDENETEYSLYVNVVEPQERRLFVNAGKSCKLKFYGVKNAAAEFVSEDTSVAKVDDKGSVSGVSAGMTVIRCTYNGVEFRTCVYVENAILVEEGGLQRGKGNSYSLRMKAGSTQRLRFQTGEGYGVFQPVLFKSNKNNIAFVNEYGVIEARKSGKAVISAKLNGKKITIKLVVEAAQE